MKATKMIIKDHIVELAHSVIRSPSWDLQEEVLAELRGEWRNLTKDEQDRIIKDMRWWTAIARYTPTEETKDFLSWAHDRK